MNVMIFIIGLLMGVVLTAMIAYCYQRIQMDRAMQRRFWREEKRRREKLQRTLEKPAQALERSICEQAERGLERRG